MMPVMVSAPETEVINLATLVCTCVKLAASVPSVPGAMPVILLLPIGMLAVGVVCPSLVIQVDRPVARSAVNWLKTVDEMTVLATTGCPAELMRNVPDPLKLIALPSSCALHPSPANEIIEVLTVACKRGQVCAPLR